MPSRMPSRRLLTRFSIDVEVRWNKVCCYLSGLTSKDARGREQARSPGGRGRGRTLCCSNAFLLLRPPRFAIRAWSYSREAKLRFDKGCAGFPKSASPHMRPSPREPSLKIAVL